MCCQKKWKFDSINFSNDTLRKNFWNSTKKVLYLKKFWLISIRSISNCTKTHLLYKYKNRNLRKCKYLMHHATTWKHSFEFANELFTNTGESMEKFKRHQFSRRNFSIGKNYKGKKTIWKKNWYRNETKGRPRYVETIKNDRKRERFVDVKCWHIHILVRVEDFVWKM